MRTPKSSAKQYLWKALDKMTEEYKDIYREKYHNQINTSDFEIEVPRPISERLNVILTLLRIQLVLEGYVTRRNKK